MAFQRPTLTQIIDRVKADVLSRIDGASTLLRRSVLMVFAKVFSGQHHLQYGYLEDAKNQLFILKADSEFLEIQATEYGISRKSATLAGGNLAVTGTTGTAIAAGSELSIGDQRYTVDTGITIAAGVGTIEVTCTVAGESGNQDAGAVLNFVSPIAGIDTTATVDSSGLTGGVDTETDSAFRARVLSRKRQAPHSGALFDYEAWMLEFAGVTRSWAIDQYYGDGTIGCVFVMDDAASIIPNESQRQSVLDYINDHTDPITGLHTGKPVGARPIMVVSELETLDFTIQLEPNTASVQSSVSTKINDVIFAIGGPGETIHLSKISEAISSAVGETAHRLIFPTSDISTATNKIPVLGTITFEAYA